MLAHHYLEALSLAKAAGLDTTALREPARRAFAEGARRAFSLGAGEIAHRLALDALELTPADDPQRPHLQLVAAYAGRIASTDDAAELLEPAIEAFIAQGDFGHAAEASVLLGSDCFYRGDIEGVRAARGRGLELGARLRPPPRPRTPSRAAQDPSPSSTATSTRRSRLLGRRWRWPRRSAPTTPPRSASTRSGSSASTAAMPLGSRMSSRASNEQRRPARCSSFTAV